MSHWKHFAPRNSLYTAPLRPPAASVRIMADLAGRGPGRVLLLGVTPELAATFEEVLSVDKSKEMIAAVWPGDDAHRKAVEGDWLALDFAPGAFRAMVGDGSLNNIPDPAAIRDFLARGLGWLRPGGLVACRVFERPEKAFTREDILAKATAAPDFNFHALKWMTAMHLAARHGATVPVSAIRTLFIEMFPDRARLARDTGWSSETIGTIDVYDGSPLCYIFPNRREILAMLPEAATSVRISASGEYPLSECCPIVSFVRA